MVSKNRNQVSSASSNLLYFNFLRACSHEPGTVNYPGVMIAPGKALPRVHMMICSPGTTLPRASSSSSDHYDFTGIPFVFTQIVTGNKF